MARRGVRSALLGRDQINLSMLADEVDPAAPQAYVKPGEVKFSKVEHQVMLWDVLTGSVHEHLAVVRLQKVWRRRRAGRLAEDHEFLKYVDPASGEFYFTKRDDPSYVTWSVPAVVGGLDARRDDAHGAEASPRLAALLPSHH